MKIVLHSKADLEPITIIELPFEAYRALIKDKVINLKVSDTSIKIYCVACYGKEGVVKESFGDIFVAEDDAIALALVPALLLGQENFKQLGGIK